MGFFNKSTDWWLGENSIFGKILGQTKYSSNAGVGSGGPNDPLITVGTQHSVSQSQLMIAIGFIALIMVMKK
jgi:hypothetical protein